MNAPGKMKVGYFTQYQVEELDGDDTPLEHMTRAMKGQRPARSVRNWAGSAFPETARRQKVGKLSGGERARLALALITRDAPHLLILDEPTNHLDVDAREALVQALNAYTGAVILISHDRHMVELTADRLVLVDNGTAKEYSGSMEDYIDFVLGTGQPKKDGEAKPKKGKSGATAKERAGNTQRAGRPFQGGEGDGEAGERAIGSRQGDVRTGRRRPPARGSADERALVIESKGVRPSGRGRGGMDGTGNASGAARPGLSGGFSR